MERQFIRIDDRERIIHGYSDEFEEYQEGDIEINADTNAGRHFVINIDGEWLTNPSLTNEHGVPLYKWSGTEIQVRTPKEIEDDTPEPPELPDPPPDPPNDLITRIEELEDEVEALQGTINTMLGVIIDE